LWNKTELENVLNREILLSRRQKNDDVTILERKFEKTKEY